MADQAASQHLTLQFLDTIRGQSAQQKLGRLGAVEIAGKEEEAVRLGVGDEEVRVGPNKVAEEVEGVALDGLGEDLAQAREDGPFKVGRSGPGEQVLVQTRVVFDRTELSRRVSQ